MKHIHPFPARMAPEIAINRLNALKGTPTILDPMMGSGTVVSASARKGFRTIGRDLDPLAVLISKSSCYNPCLIEIDKAAEILKLELDRLAGDEVSLPWIDEDEETRKFVDYWFSPGQQKDLRKLSYLLVQENIFGNELNDIFKVALSRIIITKDSGASLARDVSHSRPHKVKNTSDYDVVNGFFSSLNKVMKYYDLHRGQALDVNISLGDARSLEDVPVNSVDLVITSPPYLNAIDYMRGHRLSLVWLGMTMKETRSIRSHSIGAERSANSHSKMNQSVLSSFGEVDKLPVRLRNMLVRYSCDLLDFSSSMGRVVKKGGEIVLVMGDSRLKGVEVKNSTAIIECLKMSGFAINDIFEREIPIQHRYLPTPKNETDSLSKRMRKEVVISALAC